jgi:hypothetical protein
VFPEAATMTTRNLSRDQKRQQKLARRASAQPSRPASVKQYRAEKYVKALMRAEMGIHETDVILGRKLMDHDVEASVHQLMKEVRASEGRPEEEAKAVAEGDLVAWSIKRNWQDLFRTQPRHSNADLAGILRLILDSMYTWSGSGNGPRGYLNFIDGFLGHLGVRVAPVPLGGELDEEE